MATLSTSSSISKVSTLTNLLKSKISSQSQVIAKRKIKREKARLRNHHCTWTKISTSTKSKTSWSSTLKSALSKIRAATKTGTTPSLKWWWKRVSFMTQCSAISNSTICSTRLPSRCSTWCLLLSNHSCSRDKNWIWPTQTISKDLNPCMGSQYQICFWKTLLLSAKC